MKRPYSRMSALQLGGVVKDYAALLPHWTMEHGASLARADEHVRQHICFDALRTGGYRPWCVVGVLSAAKTQILFKYVELKFQNVSLKQHGTRIADVMRSMRREFSPDIGRPLDASEVFSLGEADVLDQNIRNVGCMCALAALAAELGNASKARNWCNRALAETDGVSSVRRTLGQPLQDWEAEQRRYASGLLSALEQGTEREFLKGARGRGT